MTDKMTDRTSTVFGNPISASTCAKATKKKAGYLRKFGGNGALDAGGTPLALSSVPNPVLHQALGVRNLVIAGSAEAAAAEPIDAERGIVIGNIRMGYGHYRIAMAMASAIKHRGYTPYWFDLNGYSNTVSGRIVSHLNDLYSFGSRLSQKSALFNKFYWEPLNYEVRRPAPEHALHNHPRLARPGCPPRRHDQRDQRHPGQLAHGPAPGGRRPARHPEPFFIHGLPPAS